MKESEFQSYVVERATFYGWRSWHVPTPMKPIGGNKFVPDARGRGLLDLLLIHEDPPRIIFAECKTHGGKLSVEQIEMMRLLRLVSALTVDVDGNRTIGVYLFQPGIEPYLEVLFRSKVVDA